MLEFGQSDRKGQIKTLNGLRTHLGKLQEEVRKFSALIQQLESVLDLPPTKVQTGPTEATSLNLHSIPNRVKARRDPIRSEVTFTAEDCADAKRSDYIDIEADLIRLLSVTPMRSVRKIAAAIMESNPAISVGKSTVDNRLKSSPRFQVRDKYWTVVNHDGSKPD
jgi:hypothetical protein